MSKFYVTKYAATKGIIPLEGPRTTTQLDGTGAPTGIVLVNGPRGYLVLGKDCYENLDEARKDAIKRTRRKVTALFKKEEKLEGWIGVWERELPS